jgi:hypothetical protein
MRELYSSPNGDCWHLCRDASGYVFVLHQPNIPSGGRASRIELSDFVAHGRGPEQQALLHILGSLIEVVTERKRREAQLLILAREAEHRAKNMLSIVLATVQLSHADTTHELRAIEGRIQAFANVAGLFAESRWKGADLQTVVTEELSPFCQQGLTVCHIEGPSIILEPNTAQAIAITLHELTTNAAKYGALSTLDGRVCRVVAN